MSAKIGIVIAVAGAAAFVTGPGNPRVMNNPIQHILGGTDALLVAGAGLALWFLAR